MKQNLQYSINFDGSPELFYGNRTEREFRQENKKNSSRRATIKYFVELVWGAGIGRGEGGKVS